MYTKNEQSINSLERQYILLVQQGLPLCSKQYYAKNSLQLEKCKSQIKNIQ